jgi:hypothetical protein
MSLIADAGALIALERGDRQVISMFEREAMNERFPCTHGGVVGQVWRGGTGRQARLARFLAGMKVVPLDDELARRAGFLLAQTRTSDVVDAAVVLLAEDGDWILTSNPDDLRPLVEAAGLHVDVIPV